MRFDSFSFGSIQIDGITYEHDVVIDHGGGEQSRAARAQSGPHRELALAERVKHV